MKFSLGCGNTLVLDAGSANFEYRLIPGFHHFVEVELTLLEDPGWSTFIESSLMVNKSVPLPTNATVVFSLSQNATNTSHALNDLWAARDPLKDTATHYHVTTLGYDYTTGGR